MILQRYMGSHLEDLLENERLKVSKVDSFNDPFEFKFDVKDSIPATKEFFRGNLPNSLKLPTEDINGATYREYIIQQHIDECLSICRSGISDISNKIRILCLSSTENGQNDILRWSHYTKNHTGFRISFDQNEFYKKLKLMTRKVVYQDKYTKINLENYSKKKGDFRLNQYHEIIKSLHTKNTCWTYENEYRTTLVKDNYITIDNLDYLKIPPKLIKQIDFGLRYHNRDRTNAPKEIPEIIDHYLHKLNRNIILTQAQCNPEEYKIDYYEIDKKKTIKEGELVYTGKIL